MPIGITPEHEDLARTVRRWLETYCAPEVPRATLADPPDAPPSLPEAGELPIAPPAPWEQLAAQGWLGLAIDEEHGGQGFGLVELAVVLEECGRALVPGPLLPTVLAGALIALAGDDAQKKTLLPGIADGSSRAAVYLGNGALGETATTLGPILGAPHAQLLLVPLAAGGFGILDTGADGVELTALPPLDSTRQLGSVTVASVNVGSERRLATLTMETVREVAAVLSAAESAGVARWCLETASEYAKVRVQFGRPIGQFQAVKHRLAELLVAVEQIDALAWDAGAAWSGPEVTGAAGTPESLAAAVVGAIVPDATADAAKTCVQLLGGIGFTWEHDAHLYLRRALSMRQLLPGGGVWQRQAAQLAMGGVRRSLASELPEEAVPLREAFEPLVATAKALEGEAQRRFLVDEGLISPHWPKPWGREASALEQLVIDELLRSARVYRPGLAVGAWALPTLIAHGTDEQQARWVRPTLLGEITWCQLFSEPGAGSDLASLSTRAVKVDGGWRLTGQKVWTSLAHSAEWGICLARSDTSVPKHEGITYFILDMRAEGIEVRPLRELTGAAMFNEVFLTDVFVPDDCVVGEPGKGWGIGRTTLANERVQMSSGATFGVGVESVLRMLEELGDDVPAGVEEEVGALVAEAQSCRLLGHRATLRSLSGTDPGAGSSVRKLLGAEHEQRIQELGLRLCGADGAVMLDKAATWNHGFLMTRCLTIAGGTSEVQRNVMAERILGQPRDPEPSS